MPNTIDLSKDQAETINVWSTEGKSSTPDMSKKAQEVGIIEVPEGDLSESSSYDREKASDDRRHSKAVETGLLARVKSYARDPLVFGIVLLIVAICMIIVTFQLSSRTIQSPTGQLHNWTWRDSSLPIYEDTCDRVENRLRVASFVVNGER